MAYHVIDFSIAAILIWASAIALLAILSILIFGINVLFRVEVDPENRNIQRLREWSYLAAKIYRSVKNSAFQLVWFYTFQQGFTLQWRCFVH